MRNRYHFGSALPEYVVPLMLLATATLISLPASGQLNSWFQSVLSQNTGGQIQNGNLIIKAGTASLSTTTNTGSQNGSQSPQPADGSGNNGSPISSNDSPSELVEVTGIFGESTIVYESVDQLETLAQQFEQSDPELSDLLTQLAQQGKTLAAAQYTYESTVSDAKSVTVQKAGALSRNNQRSDFATLYDQVINSPEVFNTLTQDQKNTVTQLSDNILNNTNTYILKDGTHIERWKYNIYNAIN